MQAVLLGINPLVIIGAFWMASLNEWRLDALPLLGLFSLALGGTLAWMAARVLRMDRVRTGTMFVQGSFTNMGSFGTLFCFVFLGEQGLVFGVMFRLLEELMYYLVGFPVAKAYGEGGQEQNGMGRTFLRLVKDPFIIVSFIAILIGGTLNFSGLERPAFYSTLNEWLVPLGTFLLLISIGFHLKIGSLRGYWKESAIIGMIKFVLVPICTVGIAYGLGLGQIDDGLMLKVVLIMSTMPPAMMAMIPTQLYNLDKELAGAIFVINNMVLVIVLPVLYMLVNGGPW